MKILYVVTILGIGGAEIITVDIANQMAQRGHDVAILHLRKKNKQRKRIDPSITVLSLNMQKSFSSFFHSLLQAKAFIKEWKPDIIHAQMFHANIFCRTLRCITPIPKLICTEHSNNIEGKHRMLIYRITDFLSNINTNVSNNATQQFIKDKAFSKKKTLTIYNGINLKRFISNSTSKQMIREEYKINESDFLFINAARLTEAKDHGNLIDAFSILKKKHKNVKLLIVGEGDLYSKLKSKIEQKKLIDSIILAGRHANIEDFYNASDCFVLSSAWEGFGIVLAEAMACELPVITTDAGGCAEVVDDNIFIVPPRNSTALAEKMEQIYLMSSEARIKLGKRNREKSKVFDLQTICNQWETIYQKNE